MSSRCLAATTNATRRVVPSLRLVAALLLVTLGPAAPARGQIHDHRAPVPAGDAAARIQIEIERIFIIDDGDFIGDGEIRLRLHFVRCTTPCDLPDEAPHLLSAAWNFSAGNGEFIETPRILPGAGDTLAEGVTTGLGIPLHPGVQYYFAIEASENDPGFQFIPRNFVKIPLDAENGWAIGRHVQDNRGSSAVGDVPDYQIVYHVRPMPLPDLRPVNIKVLDAPGSGDKLVCMGVQNIGTLEAGAFEVALRVDGVIPPNGKALAGRLGAGEYGELCVQTALPESGQHQLAAVADEPHGLFEFDDTNNRYEQPYVAARTAPNAGSVGPVSGVAADPGSAPGVGAGPGSAPVPPPSQAQADLVVSAIRVRGKIPSGQDDCKAGKNPLSVVVKNQGASATGSFAVRLLVDKDDGDAIEASAGPLDPGKDQEVRFDDVRLKKGERTLTATADAQDAVSESKEDNNKRTVTAKCGGDDA